VLTIRNQGRTKLAFFYQLTDTLGGQVIQYILTTGFLLEQTEHIQRVFTFDRQLLNGRLNTSERINV
jgi:hypothetical protein